MQELSIFRAKKVPSTPPRTVKTESTEEAAGLAGGLERPKSLLIPAMDLSKHKGLALSLDSPETPR
jgi:hypothetical protein